MGGLRKSLRLSQKVPVNTAPQNTAPQNTTPQSDGRTIDAAKEKHGGKRKADTEEGSSREELRAPKIQRLEPSDLPASLGVPSIATNNFPEDAPMTGTSVGQAANPSDHQGPAKSTHEQEPYYVDESHFEETFTSVTSLTEEHVAPGWDTKKFLRGRSTYRLKKDFGLYWLEISKVKRSECEKRFEDILNKETENWKVEAVKAVAIEYKQELSEHRFNMGYFFDRRNWKENKNGVLRMPWAIQVELIWRDEMTGKTHTTWEIPSKVWRLLRGRDKAEKAMLNTAKKRAEISRELEERNLPQKRWETPSPDAWARTQAGTGMGTTSTAISGETHSPAVKIEPPSPQTRSKSPFMFADGGNSPQDPASAQKQPQYDQARSYPTPSPDPYDNAGQVGTNI
ncbi:hypothetical protein M0657_011657 [Pyricularia oryzae]|uniref:Uncharacterized protein n=1 Tax=Pyricularia oryzae (strain Y34) TaxID=1143189 RepID=A0AA97NPF6_PYRO3|nr:hypothetical protein OOU_Y34scaffold00845g3 [Pyricularia oryzae Y34]KAI7909843.1 hypothetical protein M0657_011657 [Pyricularia oryzae]